MQYKMMTEEENYCNESFNVADQPIFKSSIPCSTNAREAFVEYFLLDTFQHKLLYTSKHIPDYVQHGYDPLSGFVSKKLTFETNLRLKIGNVKRHTLESQFHSLQKQITPMTSDKCLKIPSYMAHLLKFVRNDPDQHYFGMYNWYYSGGTLQTYEGEYSNFLIFVEKADKECLCMVPLEKSVSWHLDSSQITKAVPCEGQEIYQVKGVNSSHLIGVRQKSNCLLFSVPESNEENVFQEKMKIESDIPFSSFDISSTHNELCTINVNCGLAFWDINQEKLPCSICFVSDNSPYDKWHSLWYSSSSSSEVVVASRNSVRWMDRRSNRERKCVELRCICGQEEDEEVSLHFESQCYPNGVYIATNVGLLLMDVRMLEVPVHKWSHRMVLPPLYSSVVHVSEGKEIVCIANHYPGDVILAFSTPANSYPLVELPSRLDSLLTYQAHGKCLDPSLRSLLAPGLIGLTTISSPGCLDTEVLTLSQTSAIFSQSVFKSVGNSSEHSSSKDFSCLVNKKEKLNASSRWDLSKLYESICVQKNAPLQSEVNCSSPPVANQKWQWNVKDLGKFKDVLSSVILDEWDDVVNNENKLLSNGDKVSAWLDTLN